MPVKEEVKVKLLSKEEIDAIRAENEVRYPSIHAPAFIDFSQFQVPVEKPSEVNM